MNIKKKISDINPIVKTVSLSLLTFASVLAANLVSKLFLAIFSIFVFFFLNLDVKIKTLKNILIFAFISCFANIFCSSGNVIFNFGAVTVTDRSLYNFSMMFLSMSTLWINSLIMIKSISSSDIPYVAKFFLNPFKRFGANVSEISMVMTLVMRFVPVITKESKKVILAQEARGAKLLHGSFLMRFKYIIPTFIPILVSCFRRAMSIADAMESRCYGAPFDKTSLKENKLGFIDIIIIFVVFLVIFGVLLCNTLKIFYLF